MDIKLIVIGLLGYFLQSTTQLTTNQVEPIVIVHGGAGKVDQSSIPSKLKGVKLAARLGYKTLMSGGSVMDAVEAAVRSMELDENFNAGYGGVLTMDGDVEADAAIMNGADLNAGCVSIVKDILHPITVARRVMEKTRHNYMAGEGVMRFAKEQGFEILPAGSLVTEKARKALEDYKNSINQTSASNKLSSGQFGEPGTVGAVAIDANGNIAAATSTGGITGKLPGRIGDSSILGAGTYADSRVGGISATGHGESIMRYNVAQKVLQLIEHKGRNAQDATTEILMKMTAELRNTAGAISIDSNGTIGIYFTSENMAWAYQKGDKVYAGIDRFSVQSRIGEIVKN